MSVPPYVKEKVEGLLSTGCTLGVNTRLNMILEILKGYGLVYSTTIVPRDVMVHPCNRGSSMINHHDAHQKGSAILQAGVKSDLLTANSLCVELSTLPHVRSQQIEANKKMVASADNMLSPLHGTERFLSIASSHFTQWLRAVEYGASNPEGRKLTVTASLKPLLEEGWQWLVIKAEAEQIFLTLASFGSMSMNAQNTNALAASELECMMQLSSLYKSGMQMSAAISAVEQSAPACMAYLQDVALFVRPYAGGDAFPLLKWLDSFCFFANGQRFSSEFFGSGCLLMVSHASWFSLQFSEARQKVAACWLEKNA